MCRQVFATVLIAGWIVLSGFDVLEDLDSPVQAVISKDSRDASPSSNVGSRGALANNMIESAYRMHQDYTCRFAAVDLTTNSDSVPSFRAYFQLHKLYRVFLI
jgi:hypothetical protein